MTDGIVDDREGSAAGLLPAMSRRDVLSAVAAASALAAVPLSSAWAAARPAGMPTRAIFDRGVPQGLAFAERARGGGLSAFGFSGDVSRIWFDQLLPALEADRGPLIGLTGAGALFCFEQLAWQLGMRVRLRVDHMAARGDFSHVSAGVPSSVLARLQAAKFAFGEKAADLALDGRAAWRNHTHAAAAHPGTLVTWVIAPLDLA